MHSAPAIPLLVATCLLLLGCAAPSQPPTPRPATPTRVVFGTPLISSANKATSGGEPRGTGYWVTWSTCGQNSQAKTAADNGGRKAGWTILDDLLKDPGIQVGNLDVTTCPQGVSLLQMRSFAGDDRADDAAYRLAAQMVAAELNVSAGAASCPSAEGAVIAGQTLLASLGFDGSKAYLSAAGTEDKRQLALSLAEQLSRYNSGQLCVK